jgi:hypothetical protein
LFRDQLTPELASFFLSPRHAAQYRRPAAPRQVVFT